MRRGLRDHTCIYCNSNPSTKNGDHVFARQFVAISERDNLPKVPCCIGCNGEKSQLEHYLTAILPFASRRQNALETLKLAEARLKKNAALKRELAENMIEVFDPIEVGESTIAFQFQTERLLSYASWLCKGLLFEKVARRVPLDRIVRSYFASKDGDLILCWNFFHNMNGLMTRGELGRAGLLYEAISTKGDQPLFSVWRFELYSGATFADEKGGYSQAIWSFVVSPDQLPLLEKMMSPSE